MQTTTLTNQPTNVTNGGSAAPARKSDGGNDGSQFSAMLSNEMSQRQAAVAEPDPAPPVPAPVAPSPTASTALARSETAPASTDDAQPAKADDAATAAASAAGTTAGTSSAKAADTDTDADDTATAQTPDAAAKADPAAAMLALMASLQQPAQGGGATATVKAGSASQAFDALGGGGGKARRGDTQLAALQAAMKSVSKDGAASASAATAAADPAEAGKTFGAAALKNPALAAAGSDPGTETTVTGVKAGDTGELRAALGAAGMKVDAKPLEAADLMLQQAREAAQQASAAGDALPVAAALAQPAMLEAAQAAAVAGENLSARVGTTAWDDQVGQKIVYMLGSEEQTASLTLNPPDLGPLQVVLSVSNDQASVSFSSNQLEVRQALENALPRLREMMSESGIALGNASVGTGMPDGRQAQDGSASSSNRGFGRSSGRGDAGADTDTAVRTVTRSVSLGDRGMVDTFA